MSTYTAWSVTFGEQPSAAKWNILGTNMAYFYELLNGTNGIDGWTASGIGVSSVTYNSNRSYTLTMASSVASVLSPGMRVRTTRTVAAPTRCTSLNGSTQYWVKTSPNKLTFTDDFVISAWVKLTSYGGASGCAIVSRQNGTSGFELRLGALGTGDGRVQLTGYNAGSGNYSTVVSYQSVPLNRWIHITAQLDMSSFTATSTTSYVMFDGANVPCFVQRGGTNPTALIQAGDLQVGASNAAAFFPGSIAQVAIFNAKVTQSTIRGYIAQGLSGTETSVASAYSFNNSTSDLNTTTPNDLVAGAGAPTATNADSPFALNSSLTATGTLDYGIVQSVSGTTLVLQLPEGCTVPTSGGVSSLHYAVAGTPIGWVVDKGRWAVTSEMASRFTGLLVSGTVYNHASYQLAVPIGAFDIDLSVTMYVATSGAVQINADSDFASTAAATPTLSSQFRHMGDYTASVTEKAMKFSKKGFLNLSAMTTYYFNVQTNLGSGTMTANQIFGDRERCILRAVPAGV